jgi:hypothetical protein
MNSESTEGLGDPAPLVVLANSVVFFVFHFILEQFIKQKMENKRYHTVRKDKNYCMEINCYDGEIYKKEDNMYYYTSVNQMNRGKISIPLYT